MPIPSIFPSNVPPLHRGAEPPNNLVDNPGITRLPANARSTSSIGFFSALRNRVSGMSFDVAKTRIEKNIVPFLDVHATSVAKLMMSFKQEYRKALEMGEGGAKEQIRNLEVALDGKLNELNNLEMAKMLEQLVTEVAESNTGSKLNTSLLILHTIAPLIMVSKERCAEITQEEEKNLNDARAASLVRILRELPGERLINLFSHISKEEVLEEDNPLSKCGPIVTAALGQWVDSQQNSFKISVQNFINDKSNGNLIAGLSRLVKLRSTLEDKLSPLGIKIGDEILDELVGEISNRIPALGMTKNETSEFNRALHSLSQRRQS